MNYKKLLIWVIIIAAIIRIRFAILPLTSISGDACWHYNVVGFIADNKEIPLFENLGRPVFWAPPLFHIVSAFIYSSTGIINLLPAIAGVLSLIFVYLIGKELFDIKTGVLATVFVAFIPNHMYISTIGYVDTTFTLFVLGALYFAIKDKLIWAAIFSGLAMLTKYHAVFIIPVIFYVIYLNNKRTKVGPRIQVFQDSQTTESPYCLL